MSLDLKPLQCPSCHKIYTDPIEIAVIPMWGWCTGCDHQKLDQDHEPMDFKEPEQ